MIETWKTTRGVAARVSLRVACVCVLLALAGCSAPGPSKTRGGPGADATDAGGPAVSTTDTIPATTVDVAPEDVSAEDVRSDPPPDTAGRTPRPPLLLPATVRGTAAGGGMVLTPVGVGALVRGTASGGGLRLRPAAGP